MLSSGRKGSPDGHMAHSMVGNISQTFLVSRSCHSSMGYSGYLIFRRCFLCIRLLAAGFLEG